MAAMRPAVVTLARYSATTRVGRPSAASGAIEGTNASYSSSPVRASERVSSRAYVSDPPTTPGTSVRRLIPTLTPRAYVWWPRIVCQACQVIRRITSVITRPMIGSASSQPIAAAPAASRTARLT